MSKLKRKTKLWVALTATVLGLFLLFFAVPLAGTAIAYESFFGQRFTTGVHNLVAFDYRDFGLTRTRSDFNSDKNQRLAGWVYEKPGAGAAKGLVAVSHGIGGGGHNSYLPDVSALADAGYKVFAYDSTGCDDSGGESVLGLPQGVLDLHYALLHVEADPELSALPLLLYGHSWGGYAVCAVPALGHNVRAIVSRSGFIAASDMIHAIVKPNLGGITDVIMPYIDLYQSGRFGETAGVNGLDGLAATDAKVLLMHSADDPTVPFDNFERYRERFGADARFTFRAFEGRSHEVIYTPEVYQEFLAANEALRSAMETAGGMENVSEYAEKLARMEALLKQTDRAVFDEIAAFYGAALAED